VNNYAVNPNAFTSTTGWYVQPNASGAKATLELVSDPPFSAENINAEKNFTSYLKFPNNGGALVNSSINSHKSSLEGFIKGKDRYILRLKYKTTPSKGLSTKAPSSIQICRYGDMDDFKIEEKYFVFSSSSSLPETFINKKSGSGNEEEYKRLKEDGYLCFEATCQQSLSGADLKNWDKHYGLFIKFNDSEIYVEDIQLFPYILDDNDRLCVPDGELFSKVETIQRYYDPNKTYTSLEEVEFETDDGNFVLKYAEGAEAYTKVSSITAKESNRFNLLQDLNEKFECWARFRVEHNEDGSIKLGKDKGLLTGDEAYR
jgi:hypothetical protein